MEQKGQGGGGGTGKGTGCPIQEEERKAARSAPTPQVGCKDRTLVYVSGKSWGGSGSGVLSLVKSIIPAGEGVLSLRGRGLDGREDGRCWELRQASL